MDERNSLYELQQSRNGLTVPVINNVYLHSIYNPQKEAESFAETHLKNLKFKNHVLILGLGFGYHVEKIAAAMKSFHENYQIYVIEPNEKLVNDFQEYKGFEDKNIQIIQTTKTKDLFGKLSFINFLMNKPCILKHDPSFILEKEFFSSFLSYTAPTDFINYKSLLTDRSKMLFENAEARSFHTRVEEIKSTRKIVESRDFLTLALNEIKSINTQGK